MATVIDFTTGQTVPATIGHVAAAAHPVRSERSAKRHPDAKLLELGGRLLQLMRDWETFDDTGMTDEQAERLGDVYEELVGQLRSKIDAISPRTMAGVHMRLRVVLLDGDLSKTAQIAIADNKLTKRDVGDLCGARRSVWRLIKDIERVDGWQGQGEGA